MKLTQGRSVRYVISESDIVLSGELTEEQKSRLKESLPGRTVVGIVTEVHDAVTVDLTILPSPHATGLQPLLCISQKKLAWPAQPGCWHWPPEFLQSSSERRQIQRESRGKGPRANGAAKPAAHKLPVRRSQPAVAEE